MIYGMILTYSLNFCSSAAILVRHPGLQNLYIDCGVCEVPNEPYYTQNK